MTVPMPLVASAAAVLLAAAVAVVGLWVACARADRELAELSGRHVRLAARRRADGAPASIVEES